MPAKPRPDGRVQMKLWVLPRIKEAFRRRATNEGTNMSELFEELHDDDKAN